ncbi:undecaprenyldiphospho-muramoylpentapeptide beta-N-acetylglucosaminyltransferase [Paramuribaculum intestinale]|uniref:UDP-N-acetylglucosamine--N-acetylmuramyl-(pentapeptide) pyrophosphoryl-undecaprenol N-acetylglucosamine transferase n=1 Tax=Paramuribaculum intestinale TaxID=2094151 RepID=A0A2V1ITM8_9BACT|nr:undecaprenyldiphospho-muramoylpentapeptide beta-N-acetylglucosaminyltransferase [Paramuribaculum intestinale]MBJ2186003.1 undecaprenyldiphospho-muramoylpentapeptide beta-N-acetylglucosaminyltransferase [Muribaculaceae bacterium]ROT16652.1 undecaprenyldiphospho-muramoylpentapeptide beta-N-acetylglucosaminyltransferase [Muribaculaceae bacterium Isolate-105 (HZI)]MCX4329934.1 undecaprenyldiphospho-muramoylpentapeptide beta-N-acetylglucosaminyltransferase [Paramuribaculum intestinale]PWB06519.1 
MKQDNNKIKILISGGGTGGHIFPALSIANAMRRRLPDCEILFVGALGRMEMERVPAAGYRIEGLPVAGFDRKRLWRNFGVLLKLWKSMRKARRIVADFAPDAAVGVGGYASGPVLKEAQKRGIPTLIQEQNSYAGVTNKLLAPHATAICTAYEGMERFFPADRITLTGNPVRKELTQCSLTQAEAKKSLGFDPERPLIFVTGGSLGARTVNDAVAAMLPRFRQRNTQLLWQTGRLYEQECMAKASGYADVKASAFIADMATAYRAADLVVARAGAGTISELQLLGKAAILIPSPNVAEDHQRRNAEALSDRGAALMLLDSDAVERLGNMALTLVNDKAKLAKLAEAAGSMAMNGSDDKIADILISLIHTDK